jgi:hypothetical protein
MMKESHKPKFASIQSRRIEAMQTAEMKTMPATQNQIRQMQRLGRYGYTSQNCTREQAINIIYEEIEKLALHK